MGVTSAPAAFQRLMQATMSDFMFQFLLVLQRVTETGLKPKLSKCQFLRRQITYLEHTISAEGVSWQR